MNKPSVTGLINQQHETHRLENLFHKQVGSAYYLPDYGLDWDFFQTKEVEIPVGSFLSYLNQKAMLQGIVVLDQVFEVNDFTLTIRNRLLSEETTLSRGI